MATNKEAVQAFMEGRFKSSQSVFSLGDRINSYGDHYLIAKRVVGKGVWVNEERVSNTTSRHRYLVVRALEERGYVKQDATVLGENHHTYRLWSPVSLGLTEDGTEGGSDATG